MKKYEPKVIEPKWQKIWQETNLYTADLESDKPKYIAMSMFNYPKVVQATMGSIARVAVFYTDLATWLSAQASTGIYAAVLEGKDIRKMDPLKEGILLIGNESKGISPEILALANHRITIPQNGKAESLKAAVAAGIILSHLVS